MIYRVEWLPSAEQDLAAIWLSAPDRAAVSAASHGIDVELEQHPHSAGESRAGVSRLLVCAPLAVEYDIIEDDTKVVVWHVWQWGTPPS